MHIQLLAWWASAHLVQLVTGITILNRLDVGDQATWFPVRMVAISTTIPFVSLILLIATPGLLHQPEAVLLLPFNFVAAFAALIALCWPPRSPRPSLIFRAAGAMAALLGAFVGFLGLMAFLEAMAA